MYIYFHTYTYLHIHIDTTSMIIPEQHQCMSKGTNHARKKTYFVETDLQMRPTNSHEIHLSATNTSPKNPTMHEKRPMCTK